LFLKLDAPLTDAGGQVGLLTSSRSLEFIYNVGDDECTNTFDVQTSPFRSSIDRGFLQSIPEPSMIALILFGLIGLGFRARKTI